MNANGSGRERRVVGLMLWSDVYDTKGAGYITPSYFCAKKRSFDILHTIGYNIRIRLLQQSDMVLYRIATLILVLVIIGYSVVNHRSEDLVTATVAMDGKGHYLLTNYKIDKEGCLSFVDFTEVEHEFCGAYEVTPIEHYLISPERKELLKYY